MENHARPNHFIALALWAMLVMILFTLTGCAAQKKEKLPEYPPNPDTKRYDSPIKMPDPTPTDNVQGRMSDTDKQAVVQRALLNLQRLLISTNETIKLAAGPQPSTAARDAIMTKLAELTFKVVQSEAWLGFDPSESQMDEFRKANDFNLAILVDGGAKQQDKFGNFYSFESQLRGKVINLTTHQIIATKTILKRGKRALDEQQGAESAQEAAATDLANYLTDEIARNWEATSLVKMDLLIDDVDSIIKADDIRIGLQRKPGVYYASLEGWDEKSKTTHYEVLCTFAVQRFLPTYVDDLRNKTMSVKSVSQHGEVIRAVKDRHDK